MRQQSERKEHGEIRSQQISECVTRNADLASDDRTRQTEAELNPCWDEQNTNGRNRPLQGMIQHEPGIQEERERYRLDQAAAQIIENLPAIHERDRIRDARTGF